MLLSTRLSSSLQQAPRNTLRRRLISTRSQPQTRVPRSSFFTETHSPSPRPVPPVTSVFRRTFASRFHPNQYDHLAAKRVLWTIIGLNTAVFGAWTYAINQNDLGLRQKLYDNFTLNLSSWQQGRAWTLITSAFSHNNLLHFGFNMMAFYALASILTWVPGIGAVHMLSLCLGSAAAGSYAFLYHIMQRRRQNPVPKSGVLSNVKRQPDMVVGLGASGMVMGVGAAAACLAPFTPMRLLLIPFNIPLWAITLLYAGVDTYYLHSNSPVGHAAHLGGSIFGLLYYFAILRRFGGVSRMIASFVRRR